MDRTTRDRRAARWWHRIEFGVVLGLVVVSAIGLAWSEVKNSHVRLVETHRR